MGRARNTFSKALALNPEALKSLASTGRTLEEAIKTQRRLQQLTRQQAEEEVEWARQEATDALLNALNAVRRASNYVSRELEESKRITSTAESLKESSQDELERAERILSDAEALVRREARRLLDEPWTAGRTPSRETVVPSRRRTRDTKPRRTTGKPRLPEDRPVVSAQQQPSEAVPKEPSSISSEPLTQPSNAVSPGDLESALNEFLRSVEGGGPEPSVEEELVEVPREQPEDLSFGELDSLKKEVESFKSQEADAVTQPEVQEENLSETIGDLQQPPTEAEKEFRDQPLEKPGDTLGGSQPDQNLAPEVPETPNLEAAEKTLTLEPMGVHKLRVPSHPSSRQAIKEPFI